MSAFRSIDTLDPFPTEEVDDDNLRRGDAPPAGTVRPRLLPVAHDNDIYWETSGNPHGEPLIYLHGGPGGGLGAGGYRRRADPSRYLIVGIDQRGCGRSRPLVTDDLRNIRYNTTQALIEDVEAIREHLGVERWVLHGVSWGSTLALAYAQAHPERVRAIVLVAVTTTSRDEIEWITDGVGRIVPEAWQRFVDASGRRPGERVVDAYARRLSDADSGLDDRELAAATWDEWESQHIRLDPLWTPDARHEDPVVRRVFATLATHYWSHDGFLVGPDAFFNRIERIAHIPHAHSRSPRCQRTRDHSMAAASALASKSPDRHRLRGTRRSRIDRRIGSCHRRPGPHNMTPARTDVALPLARATINRPADSSTSCTLPTYASTPLKPRSSVCWR